MPEALVTVTALQDVPLTPYHFLIAALKTTSCKADNGSFIEHLTEVVLKII